MSPVAGVSRVVIRLRLEISRCLKHARSETCENISSEFQTHESSKKECLAKITDDSEIMACEGEGHNIDSRPFDKSCVKKKQDWEHWNHGKRAWYQYLVHMFFILEKIKHQILFGGGVFLDVVGSSHSLSIWSCSALQPPTKFTPKLKLLYNFYIYHFYLQISHCIFCLFFLGWGRGCQSSPNQPLVPELFFPTLLGTHRRAPPRWSVKLRPWEINDLVTKMKTPFEIDQTYSTFHSFDLTLLAFMPAKIHVMLHVFDVFFGMVLRKIH